MTMLKFVALNFNTGAMAINDGRRVVTLHKVGVPLKAGDLAVGEIIMFDRATGEIESLPHPAGGNTEGHMAKKMKPMMKKAEMKKEDMKKKMMAKKKGKK